MAKRILGSPLPATLETIANKAREWAGHYKPHSDGQNTFVLFAEWVESLANQDAPTRSELSEWKQAASVEAGLRREFSARVQSLEGLLAQAVNLIDDARSNSVAGSQYDEAWDECRNQFYKDRAALQQSPPQGETK